jgi:hypothetical protein
MKERKTLVGRILRGVGLGILDAVPFVSQVVSSVRETSQAKEPAGPVDFEPVARTVTGWAGVAAFIAGILSGALDCEALTGILNWLGWPVVGQ